MRKPLFGKFKSPYTENGQYSIDDCYRAYKQDPLGIIEKDGHVYSRIISCCRFFGYEDYSYHIIWEPHTEIHCNDLLIDENRNEFIVRSFEMITVCFGEVPEWYFKAGPIIITGSNCEIGNYLTKK